MSQILLKASGFSVSYGHNKVVHEVDFSIQEREIVILMGPNGAGKSTLLKALFGLLDHQSGEVQLFGKRINPRPFFMVERGVSFVPQGNSIFESMTIEENLLMGAFCEKNRSRVNERLEEVLSVFPVLQRKRYSLAFAMSGGERQILSLARALMTRPKLLMFDEPSLGLAPKVVKDVFDKIKEVKEIFGTAVVVVEHNLKSLLKVAHRGYIMVGGRIMVHGSIDRVAGSEMLAKAFFGELG